MKEVTTEALCKGKKVVLFAVPGAFTPTCSLKHLPGFVDKADSIKAQGVDTIACISVNDAFVMDAWGKTVASGCVLCMRAVQQLRMQPCPTTQAHSSVQGADIVIPRHITCRINSFTTGLVFSYSHMHRDKIMMLADGNGQFTKAIGAELDLTDKGLGLRSRRYAMLVEDQVVKVLNLEEGGAFTISSADSILEALASK